MKIKLKDPKRVYFDRQTGATMYGDKVLTVKATEYVRQMINQGWAVEVEDKAPEPEKEPEKEPQKTAPKVSKEK